MVRFVAIHGLGCHADQGWPKVRAWLAPKHDLVAVRLAGADGPTDGPAASWGIRAQAQRIAAMVRPDDILVGHSMGGAIAVRAASLARPRALVLIEPHLVPRAGFVVQPTLALGPTPGQAEMTGLRARLRSIRVGDGTYDASVARWDWRVFHAMSLELANGDGGATTWLQDLQRLQETGCPTRLLWGALSRDAGEDVHRAALAAIGITPTMVQGSAHFVPSENPRGLAQALDEAARTLPAATLMA